MNLLAVKKSPYIHVPEVVIADRIEACNPPAAWVATEIQFSLI